MAESVNKSKTLARMTNLKCISHRATTDRIMSTTISAVGYCCTCFPVPDLKSQLSCLRSPALPCTAHKGLQGQDLLFRRHPAIYLVPPPLNNFGRVPSMFWIPKPKPKQVSPEDLSAFMAAK